MGGQQLLMRRTIGFLLAVSAVIVAGFALDPSPGRTSGPWDAWGCPPEQIMFSVAGLATEGGSPTPEDALREQIALFAQDGIGPESSFVAALESRSGPTRYEPETGLLFIDGKIRAQVLPTRLDDGTWSIGSATVCGPPAGEQEPGPTPSLNGSSASDVVPASPEES